MAKDSPYGVMEVKGGKDADVDGIKVERVAIDNHGKLLFASVVGYTHHIKQLRAIITSGQKCTINIAKIPVRNPDSNLYYASSPGRVFSTEDGYTLTTQKLLFGYMHCMLTTRMPGFMRVVTPDAVWAELTDNRFTTPLIREWLPWLSEKLKAADLLVSARVANCECGVLLAQTSDLDALVTSGLKRGDLVIPPRPSPGTQTVPENRNGFPSLEAPTV